MSKTPAVGCVKEEEVGVGGWSMARWGEDHQRARSHLRSLQKAWWGTAQPLCGMWGCEEREEGVVAVAAALEGRCP